MSVRTASAVGSHSSSGNMNGPAGSAKDWIEVFHSMPSLENVYIIFSKDGGPWTPNRTHKFEDASHIREGFRVFRVGGCKRLEFAITDGKRYWDDNGGQNYVITEPGRYVVSISGLERRGDVDIEEIHRQQTKAVDQYIEILYRSPPGWQRAHILYAKQLNAQGGWTPSPGEPMLRNPEESGLFFIRLLAKELEFVFTDGENAYDNRKGKNYKCHTPGRYIVQYEQCQYLGRSQRDLLRQETAGRKA
ncbi:hypothetical protein CCYA_CCYA18G4472 [Cyanidiococcus yangmingshanensis]|nr:hypothetical protein CCYA_CCYA18G4472 [Cyanidiococcus yangmingshanensis]